MATKPKNTKGMPPRLTDEEFLNILRDNAGLYARTAREIEKRYGIPMGRSAVKQRADKFPEEVKDIKEQNIDIAEESLHSLMRSRNERVRLNAVTLFLKTIGKTRGYVERTEVTAEDGKPFAIILTNNEEGK